MGRGARGGLGSGSFRSGVALGRAGVSDQCTTGRHWPAPGTIGSPKPAGLDCASPPAAPDDPMTADEVTQLIRTGLPDAEVRVLTDDDTHFEAVVVASQFEGRRPLQRHQLVYATLGPRMGREIHALSIQAFTPGEWRHAQGAG